MLIRWAEISQSVKLLDSRLTPGIRFPGMPGASLGPRPNHLWGPPGEGEGSRSFKATSWPPHTSAWHRVRWQFVTVRIYPVISVMWEELWGGGVRGVKGLQHCTLGHHGETSCTQPLDPFSFFGILLLGRRYCSHPTVLWLLVYLTTLWVAQIIVVS
jgi:hypothetical protein